MSKSHLSMRVAISSLLLGLFLMPPVFASYAVPAENVSTGVVQAIDYASNTVTVNGHVYKIAAKAAYVSDSVKNIGGLQIGMKIRFIANGPITNHNSQITNLVVLTPESQ